MVNKDISKEHLWQRLVRKSCHRCLIMGKPAVKIDHHTITIVSDSYIRYIGLFLILAGLSPVLAVFILEFYYSIPELLVYLYQTLAVGLVLILVGLALFLRRDTITWPGFGNGIYIRHGFVFYSVVYFLALENLQASLVFNESKGFARIFSIKGNFLLTLTNSKSEGVLLVAAANNKHQLLPALNSLTAVIRGCGLEGSMESYDHTMADIQLEKHSMRIFKGSLNRSAMTIRSLRAVATDSGLVFVKSRFENVMWIILVILGLVLLPLSWHILCDSYSLSSYGSPFIVVVCLIFALVGGLGIYPGFDIQSVSFESDRSRLSIEYGIINFKSPRPRKLIINYNTIAAVQICPVHMDEFFTAYEMNLVMISNQDRRVYLAGYFNLERVRKIAELAAKEIGCELLDHTI